MKNFGKHLIIVLIMVPLRLVSQDLIYKCKVFDTTTKEPLVGATVKDLQSKQNKITDVFGICFFQSSESLSLEISFIGFENQLLAIDSNNYINKKDTIPLNIYLEKSIKILGSVEISAKHDQGVLDNKQWLYDYELQDDKLWLMCNGKNCNRLMALDNVGDTLVDTRIPENISNLDKIFGCFLIAESKDSAFRLSIKKSSITIEERFGKARYLSQVKPLMLINNYGILEEPNALTATVNFRMVDLITRKSFYLSRYINTDKARYNITHAYSNAATIASLEEDNKGHGGNLTYAPNRGINDLAHVRNAQREEWNLEFFHLKNLSVYLRLVRDSIYIINHDNDTIYVFSNTGNYNRAMALTYRIKNVHYQDVIVDEEHQNVYYKYVMRDICYLEQIDLNTGKSVNKYQIKKPYPKKIRIKNSIIYFMHNIKGLVGSNNNLYLQKM